MFPRSWPRAARLALACLVVLVMMGTGLMVSVSALMTNPAFLDPAMDEPTDLGVLMAFLGALALLTLPLYRRAPLVPMIAGALSALLLRLDPFVLAVGLTVWIIRAERRWHWAVAAVGLAVILACAGLHLYALSGWPDEDYARTGQILVGAVAALCLGLVLGISLGVRQRRAARAAEAQARAAEHSNDQLSEQLTRQQERQVLAREVHDTLASDLSGLSLHVGGLEKSTHGAGDPQLTDQLRTTRRYADQALTNLRTLLASLREGGADGDAPTPAPRGVADLQSLFAEAAASGVEVRPFVLVDGFSTAPGPLQHAVRRITQEALTNVLRHSTDRTAEVSITGAPGQGIEIRVVNQAPEAPRFTDGSGTGLIGVEERAKALGGTAEAAQRDGRFLLTVRLPWSGPEGQTP